MMEIIVNGEKKEIEEGINIERMIKVLGYDENSFAVAVNGTFVALKAYHDSILEEGDKIEILAPMVGG